METWHNWLGVIGSLLIVLAYLLLQSKKIAATDLIYSVANAVGASLVLVSLLFDFNLAAMIVELFWVLISLFGIAQFFRGRQEG